MKIKGFTDYQIDAVVKFGGSLLANSEKCRLVINALVEAKNTGYRILVIPGGGPTDNTIEDLDRRHPFCPNSHHKACARAQDQTGLMISDPVFSDGLTACENLEDVSKALDNSKVAVLLPSRLIFDLDPFERSWEITSDAMSAYFAWLVSANKLIVLTNVDGVFKDGKLDEKEALMRDILATDLIKMGHTAVDACTAPFLIAKKMNCLIINGNKPERLIKALKEEDVISTLIKGV